METTNGTVEIWQAIPDFPGYEVSSHGRVRTFRKRANTFPVEWYIAEEPQGILSPSYQNGYAGVNLRQAGKSVFKRVHYLMMITFVGPRPKGLEICHNDGDPRNNHLDNLRYDTHAANIMDAAKAGNMCKVLDFDKVEEAARLYNDGEPIQAIADKFETSYPAIREALFGRTFNYLDIEITAPSPQEKLAIRAKEIRERYFEEDVTMTDLADEYDLDVSGVSRIVNGSRDLEAGGPIRGIDY